MENDRIKENSKIISKAIERGAETCTIVASTKNDVERSFREAKEDMLLFNCEKYSYKTIGKTTTLYLYYWMSMKEYSDLRTKCIEAGNEWISSFSKVHPMKTMLDLHEKMVREQNYEENRYGHCIAGPLLYNKSVCEGFSKTVKFILNRMGIECTLVVGKGYDSDVGHMWNQVYMEKDWYNIDVTWDITTRTDGIVSFDHFMVSDRKNEYTHHSADSVNRCTSNRFDYYFYYDLIAVDDEAARRIIARELSNGKKIIYVEYKDKDMADRSQRVMEIALSEYTKRHRFKRARVSTSYDIRMQTYHIMFT